MAAHPGESEGGEMSNTQKSKRATRRELGDSFYAVQRKLSGRWSFWSAYRIREGARQEVRRSGGGEFRVKKYVDTDRVAAMLAEEKDDSRRLRVLNRQLIATSEDKDRRIQVGRDEIERLQKRLKEASP